MWIRVLWFLTFSRAASLAWGQTLYGCSGFGREILRYRSNHNKAQIAQIMCIFLGLMMTSSNGNIYRVTGHLCGELTVPVNSPYKGQWRGALMFSLICAWISGWVNNREAGDLRCNRAHYDVNVMLQYLLNNWEIFFSNCNFIFRCCSLWADHFCETCPVICIHSSHSGYWWPGALAPGH